MKYSKKLIELALPKEAINVASARERSIRHGHPSALHLWWARRPLAAARAVIFAQMADDPSARPDLFKTEKTQEKERQKMLLAAFVTANSGETSLKPGSCVAIFRILRFQQKLPPFVDISPMSDSMNYNCPLITQEFENHSIRPSRIL